MDYSENWAAKYPFEVSAAYYDCVLHWTPWLSIITMAPRWSTSAMLWCPVLVCTVHRPLTVSSEKCYERSSSYCQIWRQYTSSLPQQPEQKQNCCVSCHELQLPPWSEGDMDMAGDETWKGALRWCGQGP